MEMTNVLAFPSFILLLLIGAVAGQDAATEGPCETHPCKCPKNYRPICGTDGKTYSNKCMLKCDSQCNENLQEAYEGPCQKKSVESSTDNGDKKECQRFLCRCMNLDEPVCGVNGKTYSNKCMLHCDRQCYEGPQVAYEGPCQKKSVESSSDNEEEEECQPKPCQCTRQYQPICGTNGKTYSNRCLLQCDQQCKESFQEAYEGPCKKKLAKNPKSNAYEEECTPEPCKCTKEYHVVCGTDQRSYNNPCLLECNRDQCNPNLQTAHEGRCVKKTGRNSTGKAKKKKKSGCKPKPCPCTKEYHPVCGTDHRTYSNPCLLRCNRKQCNKKLRSAHRGRCEKKSKKRGNKKNKNKKNRKNRNKKNKKKNKQTVDCKQRSCPCTREYRPICGTDQHTYGNKCLFQCEQKCKKGLKQAHQGPCESDEDSANNGTCNPDGCVCTEEYAPVCGSNNQTYSNRCALRCDQNCNQGLQEAHQGRCESETTDKSTQNEVCNPDGCICTQEYAPVCGSNKRTYSNRCEFRCDQNCNLDLREEYDGVCKTSKSSPRKSCSRDCSCDDEDYEPVCGTNRKTYSNPCRLECDHRCNRRIKKAYNGKCKRRSKKRPTKKPGCKQRCVCPYHYWPVCGSNGKTYSNDCALKCDKRCNKSLRMVSQGSCGRPRRTTRKRPKSKPRRRRTTTTTETSDDFE